MPNTALSIELHEGTRREWDGLQAALPAPLRLQISDAVRREAPALVRLFYDTLREEPDAAAILTHDLVSTRLGGSLQAWLLSLFPAEGAPGFEAMAAQQHKVGAVHARICLPLHLVSRAARLMRAAIITRLGLAVVEREALVQALGHVTNVLDIAMELMNDAFVQESSRNTRNEEAFRLFSLGQDVSLEREAQRAAIAEWLQAVFLATMKSVRPLRLPTIAASEFGLWVHHRAGVIFGSLPALDRVHGLMVEIDTQVLPGLAEPERAPAMLDLLESRVNDIRFIISDAFQAVIGLENGRDALTRTLNRRFMPSVLARETALARQSGLRFSVMMVDIDHFKSINDRYGHAAGDAVLSQVAEIIMRTVRLGDFVFRYGGEEFCILLVEADARRAGTIAERLRAAIEEADIPLGDGPSLRVTASLGIAQFDGHPDYTRLVEAADQALYRAKHTGRNRVMAAA